MSRSKSKGPVLVAMSGGVDSSVAAALLVQRGYEVIGVTLQIWQESQTDPRHSGCCSLGAVEDARRVARKLGIAHYVLNFRDAFRSSVIDNFVSEYMAGRTPNPCVQCNKEVKFEVLLDRMREFGCRKLVTGHYVRTRTNRETGSVRLMRARAKDKDQSYVLYMLGQDQLSVSMFPMGEVPSKAYARGLAKELGLHLADKPDSQEICFVSEAGGYREFLRRVRPEDFEEGEIVDAEGAVLGKHGGVADFTVGQRRGVRMPSSDGKPLYVLKLDPVHNRVVVGHDRDLLTREVLFENPTWHGDTPKRGAIEVRAKIRYNMDPQPAVLYPGEMGRLVFNRPVRAVTPGQFAVAYRGQTVVGGGAIVL